MTTTPCRTFWGTHVKHACSLDRDHPGDHQCLTGDGQVCHQVDDNGRTPTGGRNRWRLTGEDCMRVNVVELTAQEWREAASTALARAGYTFDQLQMFARRGDFPTLAARKLWVALGGQRP